MKNTKRMLLTVSMSVLLLVSMVLPAGVTPSLSAQVVNDTGVIKVVGSAVVTAAPDVAYISLGVSTKDPSAQKASQDNSKIMTDIISALRMFGLKENEVTTSNYYIYSYQENVAGTDPVEYETVYNVNNQVNIKTNDLDAIGEIIDLAIQAGANQVSGINFDLENKEELQLLALQNATKQARKKVDAIATAIGTEVKGIVSITEQSDSYVPYTEAMMFKAASADNVTTPINPGDVQVSAKVMVEYQF